MPALEQSKFASFTKSLMLSSSFFRMAPEAKNQQEHRCIGVQGMQ